MITIKKIVTFVIIFLNILSHTTLSAMDTKEIKKILNDKRRQNKRIRRELREIQAKTIQVIHETEQLKSLAKCRKDGKTLSSHDGKNQLVTIYFKDGSQCYRSYKDFLQLMQESSSEEENDETFEHSNREDGPTNDTEQWINNEKKSKKCCCVLV